MSERTAKLSRETKETKISIELNIDGKGNSSINSGVDFFNHMLEGFSKHGFFDLNLNGAVYCDRKVMLIMHNYQISAKDLF